MNGSRTVLVVDDDVAIVEMMRDFLEAEGYRVEGAVDGKQATEVIERTLVDCILLDVMMPGESGYEICRRVRVSSDVPILFLSARGEDVDKIRGLGIGADDYIVKSATPTEVVARVKAALRRYAGFEASRKPVLDFDRLGIDLAAREVLVEGRLTPFTPREFDILSLLAENPRQVFTYAQIIEKFWEGVGDRHTITVHMSRIREKIERDPAHPEQLVNVWGIGYRFEGQRQ